MNMRSGITEITEPGEWLRTWFAVRRGNTTIAETLFENVDSLGVIELIMDIEREFSIRFTEKDWQNRKLSTVTGLAEIIREKRNV